MERNGINEVEALEIASLVAALCRLEEYEDRKSAKERERFEFLRSNDLGSPSAAMRELEAQRARFEDRLRLAAMSPLALAAISSLNPDDVALVEKASTPEQKVHVGTLATMPGIAESERPRATTLIIVGGVNYHPQDIENVVQDASEAVRPGCVAAFSSDETGEDGKLEIVFEIRQSSVQDAKQVIETVRRDVLQFIGLMPNRNDSSKASAHSWAS